MARLDWDKARRTSLAKRQGVESLHASVGSLTSSKKKKRGKKKSRKTPKLGLEEIRKQFLNDLSEAERSKIARDFRSTLDEFLDGGDPQVFYSWYSKISGSEYRDREIYRFLKSKLGLVYDYQRVGNGHKARTFKISPKRVPRSFGEQEYNSILVQMAE